MQTEFDTIAAISTAPGEKELSGLFCVSGACDSHCRQCMLKDQLELKRTAKSYDPLWASLDPRTMGGIDEVFGDGASRAKKTLRVRTLWKSTVTVGLWRLTASCNSFFAWEFCLARAPVRTTKTARFLGISDAYRLISSRKRRDGFDSCRRRNNRCWKWRYLLRQLDGNSRSWRFRIYGKKS